MSKVSLKTCNVTPGTLNMKHLTIGKLRGLQQISSARGTITALALDHRQNLRKANPSFLRNIQISVETLRPFAADLKN
jgi:tagatose-1,6-bisphosphate aldolase